MQRLSLPAWGKTPLRYLLADTEVEVRQEIRRHVLGIVETRLQSSKDERKKKKRKKERRAKKKTQCTRGVRRSERIIMGKQLTGRDLCSPFFLSFFLSSHGEGFQLTQNVEFLFFPGSPLPLEVIFFLRIFSIIVPGGSQFYVPSSVVVPAWSIVS